MDETIGTLTGERLEQFVLERLRRFAACAAAADGSQPAPWRHLARRATLTAYRDCAALGLRARARIIVGAPGAG